jgi:hypothetical protein
MNDIVEQNKDKIKDLFVMNSTMSSSKGFGLATTSNFHNTSKYDTLQKENMMRDSKGMSMTARSKFVTDLEEKTHYCFRIDAFNDSV